MSVSLEQRQRAAIADHLAKSRGAYPGLWEKIIADWQAEDTLSAAWLMYSANYLLRTAGVRWALDPYSLSERISGVARPNFTRDLARCELVVLTHTHSDHLDLTLLAGLSLLPVQFVIPKHTLEEVLDQVALPRSRIIVPQNGVPLTFGGLTLTPFDGLHLHGIHGVPATGYLAEFKGQRWLFPGDTRIYDASRLPRFGRLDGCFGHLWLGRACAAMPEPPQLDAFCAFFRALNPRRLVVTHLRELNRDEHDYWDDWHYQLVKQKLAGTFTEDRIRRALMGERVSLSP